MPLILNNPMVYVKNQNDQNLINIWNAFDSK